MKCDVCKCEIQNESLMKRLNADGDFACNEECEIKYKRDRDEFFNNIGDDAWYENYMNK